MRVPIPKNAKSNTLTDGSVGVEVLIFIFAIVLIGNKLLDGRIHSSLSPVLLLLFISCTVYLIKPSKFNHGYVGYIRLLNAIRFWSEKKRKEIVFK